MWRATLRGLFAKKFRLVLTSIAIVLGVAFMAGTFVLTDTLGSVFDNLFANTTKGVDAVVRAKEPFKASNQAGGGEQTRPPVPGSLVDTVQDAKGVDLAQGNILGYALVTGTDGEAVQNQAPTFGTPWRSPSESVNQSSEIVEGRAPRAPDEVALDLKTFEEGKFRLGDTARISFLTVEPRELEVVGAFLFGGKRDGLVGATLAAFEPETAQEVMNRVDQWDVIEVKADAGVSQTEVRDNIRRALRDAGLNGDFESITGEQLAKEQSDELKKNLSFFNTFLLVFALIALFVGAFVIYNTFSITVAQRIRELGLLRALGASGKQVVGSVVIEAFVVGALSSILGIVLGILIVSPLQGLLSAFGIDLPGGALQIEPRTIVVSFLVGTGVTMVAALGPARRASKIPPIAALRDQAFDGGAGRRRYIWGTVLLVLGVLALLNGLFGDLSGGSAAAFVGVSALLVFVGVAMLSPLAAKPAARLLTWPAIKGNFITGILARENAQRNPRRTAATAAALMIGLALVSAIAIMSQSFKTTFRSAIEDQTTADFILSPSGFAPFSPEAAQAVRDELPGSTVVEYRFGTIEIDGDGTAILGASPEFTEMTDAGVSRRAAAAFADEGGMLVHRDTAEDRGIEVGDVLDVRFPNGPGTLTVQGFFDDKKALPTDADFIVSTDNWDGFPDPLDFYVGVLKPDDVSTKEAAKIVEGIADRIGGVEADNLAGFVDRQIAQFNQILGLMYVLLLLAVVIALVGIVNTLALSVFERTREIGLMRAVGMSRVQLKRMIRGEALITASFGSLLGLAIGLFFGVMIVQAFASDGITLAIPVSQLVIFGVLAALAGLLAGVLPARRAARLDVLDAITTE
ncbi:MAG: FtsX-like permease family protein [Actinobacteria bacterium]|nr:FtsX-like permease family protein [Actinomycetota bacterium]